MDGRIHLIGIAVIDKYADSSHMLNAVAKVGRSLTNFTSVVIVHAANMLCKRGL